MDVASVTVCVNDERVALEVSPRWTLAHLLREEARLTGTKVGCAQGDCGACTVLLDNEPVRSCLVLAIQADGCHVRTIEGVAHGSTLHPLQQSFKDHHALQCGFCTPGFIMLAVWMMEQEAQASPEWVERILSANLCRCTGYQPIVESILDFQKGRKD